MFEDAGYTILDGKTGSNNGFDGLYIKGTVDDPIEIVIGEAKQWGSSGGVSVNAANTSTQLPQQMSDNWIKNVAARIRDSAKKITDPVLRNERDKLADMLTKQSNRSKISKYVTVVNKDDGVVNILKLGSF
ncbi:hypothetical protein [Reichenbachiella ulvae]|uniref:Restriction endonuclease n=1 Tax=Reichenbachiella ulvae TaxID=2980104 RepID=A0ABT3CYT2_9BACT|nr:hypothetical protein [Reichenbachiella ulvae]MCV9388650.1 hypothetical protein [Reichenbachiella ulvae]